MPAVQGKTSALAIASLVLAVLGFVTFGATAVFGLVLGVIALVRINRSNGALRGNGLALGGTILSGVLVLLLPIMAAMLLPALARAKDRAQSIVCMNNMRQLAMGTLMYANANKDQFPAADKWCDSLGKYVANPKMFQCPAGDPNQRCHYVFNSKLSGVQSSSVHSPAQTVLLFEADGGGWNLGGGPELALKQPRHRKAIGVVFADGHSEMATQSRVQNLRWDP
jgi:hypothetical protein